MAAAKKKPGTKGQKQILQENVDTLAFYRNIIAVVIAFYSALAFLFFKEVSTLDRVLVAIASMVLFGSYKFMSSMASPSYASDNSILDEGCDLNMEGGLAEHFKDLILLTVGCVGLTTISSYFWLLWLLAPARAFHLLWINVLAPYIFQPGAEQPAEPDPKKQRKMERKMMKRR